MKGQETGRVLGKRNQDILAMDNPLDLYRHYFLAKPPRAEGAVLKRGNAQWTLGNYIFATPDPRKGHIAIRGIGFRFYERATRLYLTSRSFLSFLAAAAAAAAKILKHRGGGSDCIFGETSSLSFI